MAHFTKDKYTSSVAPNTQQNCVGCTKVAVPSNGTTTQSEEGAIAELLRKTLLDMKVLQDDIMRVEREQDKTAKFYNTITKLGKISYVAVLALMIVPIVQLIGCLIIIYYLGIQEELSELFKFAVGGIGILSLIEVIIAYSKLSGIEKQIEKLENKVEKLQDQREN